MFRLSPSKFLSCLRRLWNHTRAWHRDLLHGFKNLPIGGVKHAPVSVAA